MQLTPHSESKASPADEVLMLHVVEGHSGAFEQLVRRWKQPLFNYFFHHLGEPDSAEELTQEVFVRIWRTARYTRQARFSTWVYRLAYHLLVDHWRRLGRRPPVQESLEAVAEKVSPMAGPEDLVLAAECREKIRQALRLLPERQRQLLILSKFQDLKYVQIAEILNTPVNQVKVQVFRALQSLAKKLKEVCDEEGKLS